MDKIYIKSRMADTVGLTGGLSSEITLTSDRNDELGLKGTLYAENNFKGMLDFAKGEKEIHLLMKILQKNNWKV